MLSDQTPGDLNVSCTELPSYDTTPTVVADGSARSKYHLFSIVLDQTEVRPGSFVTGQVVLNPRRDMGSVVITLEIRYLEQAKSNDGSKTEIKKIEQRLACSQIPISVDIEAGRNYSVPFSLEFPATIGHRPCPSALCGRHGKDTKCGYMHTDLPASLGAQNLSTTNMPASISYYVHGVIPGFIVSAVAPFTYTPTLAEMDFDDYFDRTGKKLQRDYESVQELSRKSWFSSSKPRAILVATAGPVYHEPRLSLTGQVPIELKVVSGNSDMTSIPHISTVDLSIFKKVFAASKGMKDILDKTDENIIHETKLPLGGMNTQYSIEKNNNGQWELQVTYTLPKSSLLNEPSFISCMTALSYDMEIRIKHDWGVTSLRLPFVLRREDLPGYCTSLTARPSCPNSCAPSRVPSRVPSRAPSLVSDKTQ